MTSYLLVPLRTGTVPSYASIWTVLTSYRLILFLAGPAMNPSTGLPDYSAQWAEYYRSIGYVQEAEKIEQQARIPFIQNYKLEWSVIYPG